jgi:hypothetical protein
MEIKANCHIFIEESFTQAGIDITAVVQGVHNQALTLQAQEETKRAKIWRAFYDRKADSGDLELLLTNSRRALYFVEDNVVNRSAKELLAMESTLSDLSNMFMSRPWMATEWVKYVDKRLHVCWQETFRALYAYTT